MKYQNLYNIIFSEGRSCRWKRHLLFWLAVYIYHLVRIGLMLPGINNLGVLFSLIKMSLTWGLLPNMFFTYSVTYYLVPKYFSRKKYVLFSLGVILIMLILQLYALTNTYLQLNQDIIKAIGHSGGISFRNLRPGFIRMLGNPPLILGLFLSLKTLKNWHLEQLKTESIARETANAELQLLKAQVHPHFLFNTLNNIYSFTLNQSPLAVELVRKLSDMLGYMIHECNEKLVPLEKEVKLIEDYIGLERVRYGTRLHMQVEINGQYKNILIAPLLLIPFVENCFKHGASMMRGEQWIHLSMTVEDDQFHLDLANSKPAQLNSIPNKKGIGLANVKKRLELLYPQKHFLKIESLSETYGVHLSVQLHSLASPGIDSKLISKLQPA